MVKKMNDFTKEELEKLLSWADVYTEFGRSWATKLQMPLIDKIQSMIDNYKEPCKHPSTNFDEGVYYCDECGYCVP